MIRKVFCSLLLFAGISALMAHEFWIQPKKYFVTVGEKLAFELYVGEDFQGEKWANRKERTEKLLHVYDDNPKNITESAITDNTDDITIEIKEEGTHMLYLHSNPSFIELDAEKFNAYLKEDDIDNILQLRTQKKELHKPAREKYERFAKTYIQCGDIYTSIHDYVLGGKLEILLKANPYHVKKGDPIEVNIQFDKKPLANKKVVCWKKSETGRFEGKYTYYTDAAGKFKFNKTIPGIWMISTVHMVPSIDTSYDYHSYWGSVSFQLR